MKGSIRQRIPGSIDNLRLLCPHYNRVTGDRPQEYLVTRLREMGMAA